MSMVLAANTCSVTSIIAVDSEKTVAAEPGSNSILTTAGESSTISEPEITLDSTKETEAVRFSWNDISTESSSYDYQLYRREKGGDWDVLQNSEFDISSGSISACDNELFDTTAPAKPTLLRLTPEDGKLTASLKTNDLPTVYEYYVGASVDGASADVASNTVSHKAISGLAGFVIKISDSPESDPGLIVYDNSGKVADLVKADALGKADITIEPEKSDVQRYFHIFAVDNANNVSEENIVPVYDILFPSFVREVDNDTFFPGEEEYLNPAALFGTFTCTFDMQYTLYYENTNEVEQVLDIKDEVLKPLSTPNENREFALMIPWTVPEDYIGPIKGVLTVTVDGKVVSYAEKNYFISEKEDIGISAEFDKKVYKVGDSVNANVYIENNIEESVPVKRLYMDMYLYKANESKYLKRYSQSFGDLAPDGTVELPQLIDPELLEKGSYRIVARVYRNSKVINSSRATFVINDKKTDLDGQVMFDISEDTISAKYTVANNGYENAENLDITIEICKDGTDEKIASLSDTFSVKSGEFVTKAQSIEKPGEGLYSVVLSADVNGVKTVVCSTKLQISAETTATTAPATTTTTSTKKTTTTATSTKKTTTTTTATKKTTTTTTSTKNDTTTTTTTTQPLQEKVLYGDANCDGSVSVADAAAILQYLGNKDKFPLSAQGFKNADTDGTEGITTKDALAIIQFKAALVDSLPLK